MNGIFISHASDDVDIVDPFVDNIVRLGCRVAQEQIFYSSGADTGIPSGSDMNATVRAKAGDAGLVVAILTPTFQTRPFCIAELGAAWSQVGTLFPLKAPGLDRDDLGGVLNGMTVRSWDDEAALDELHDQICRTAGTSVQARTWGRYKKVWLDALPSTARARRQPSGELPTPGGRTAPSATTDESYSWGQVFDSFVDAALYTGDDKTARTEIEKHIDAGTLIPSRYHYASDAGADNWLRLCRDGMYRHYRETTDFWAGPEGVAVASGIRTALQRDDFDYVSLGCGNGEKDADIISHWLTESLADVFYYPYDISLPLVSRAHKTVRDKVAGDEERLMIKAVLADFNYLTTVRTVFKHRPSPNVVALLGNSLGNLDRELLFLRKLHNIMASQDLLVLEVRLKSDEKQLQEVESKQAMRFDFGPLDYYLGWEFDQSRMRSDRMSGISSIDGTTTTVVSYRGKNEDDVPIRLSYIHEYEERHFLDALDDVGFEIVEPKPGTNKKFLVCVVRRKPKKRGSAKA